MKKIVLLAFVLVLLSTAVVVRLIRPAVAEGTIYIRADGNVEGTDKIQRNGNVYTFTDNIVNQSIVVELDKIVVNGGSYTLQGAWGGTVDPSCIGIDLTGRSDITLKNIEVTNFYHGIYLYSSSNNNISRNKITNNKIGIWIQYSSNNTISGNNITNNKWGIFLSGSSDNIVYGNDITNNEDGTYFYVSSNNIFHHNNFVDNKEHVDRYRARVFTNVWDGGYPYGGNFWSDYTNVDQYSGPYQNETGSDGIGDAPYVINAENEDRYPLVTKLTSSEMQLLSDMQLLYDELDEHLANYVELQSEYDNLDANYNSLLEELNDLESDYNSLTNELDIIRNIMYALLIATIIFIATTTYLAIREPKVKSELETP